MLDPATVADLAAAVRAAAEQQRNFDEGHFPSGGEFIAPKACAGPIWDSYVTPAGIILFWTRDNIPIVPSQHRGAIMWTCRTMLLSLKLDGAILAQNAEDTWEKSIIPKVQTC